MNNNNDFNFKVIYKSEVQSFLNWYRYYIIGAEDLVFKPSITELKNFDLCGFDFSNLDLYDITFTNCNLSNCKFNNSNLYNAHFNNCIVCHADFSDVIMGKASFIGCKLYDSSFFGCSSYDIWFSACVGLNNNGMFSSPDIRTLAVACEPLYRHNNPEVVMREINSQGLKLPDFTFYENLNVVSFPYMQFSFFNWLSLCYLFRNYFRKEVNLNQCLDGYSFVDYDFSKDNLNGFSFYRCFFKNTIFPHSNLKEITFRNSHFENIDFTFNEFKSVRFIGCILRECKISRTQLDNFKQDSSLYYDLNIID